MMIRNKELVVRTLPLPNSRKKATELGTLYYFTGIRCANDHISIRKTRTASCLDCAAAEARKRRSTNENKKSLSKYNKQYNIKNSEQISARKKVYREENLDQVTNTYAQWYANNRAYRAKYDREYARANPTKVATKNAKRRARRSNAISANIDNEKIQHIYNMRIFLNSLYGCTLHVDHIIPLCSGGMHCHSNLQLLHSSYNISKSANLYWVNPGLISDDIDDMQDDYIKEWVLDGSIR